jgi:predicted SprT family Zn-dependent metalloprotease
MFGRTIEVVERTDLIQDREWVGAADYNHDKIELLPPSAFFGMTEAKQQQVFCHEFAHFLLYHAGGAINYNLKDGGYIHKNEEFVDLIGSLLQQALTTMEYEAEKVT